MVKTVLDEENTTGNSANEDTNMSTSTDVDDTETHFKVEVPAERMVRLRKVEPGMVLSREVTNDNGQLLFPKGKTLDHHAIDQLRNFKKRAVHVKDRRTKWVAREEFERLPDSAEWLDTKEVPSSTSEDEPSEDPEESSFRKLFDFVEGTDSPKHLKEFVDLLEENLEPGDGEQELEEQLQSVRDQATDVSDLIQYLLAQVSRIDDRGTREQILESLGEMGQNRDDLLEDADVSDEMIFDLEQIEDRKHEVKQDLHDLMHDQAESLESLENEQIPETGLPQSDESSSNDPPGKLLENGLDGDMFEELVQLVREAADQRKERLFSLLEDFLGEQEFDLSALEEQLEVEPPEQSNDDVEYDDLGAEDRERIEELLAPSEGEDRDVEDCLLDTFDAMDDGHYGAAIHEFNDCLKKSLDGGPPDRFETFEEDSSQLLQNKAQLISRMKKTMNPPSDYDSFEDLLNASEPEILEEISRQEIPSDVSESARSYLDERQELVFSFWNDLRDVLPDILESVDRIDRSEVLEEFRDVTDDLLLNQLQKPMDDNLYDEEVPSGNVQSRRTELLDTAIESRDFDQIKRHSSLPDSVIEQYQNHYRRPEDTNKWQAKLLDLHTTVIEQLVLALRVPHDAVDRYLHEFNQIYESEPKLFSVFLQPPDPENYHLTHAFNTTLISLMIGRELELPENAQETLLLAGSLADVGLVVIPDSFYLVDDELSRRAQSEIQKHPVYSQKISSHIFGPQHSVPQLVAEHHERPDGNGYPRGKRGGELSPLSGVIGSADTYTALIEERPYRSAKLPDEALTVIRKEADGIQEKPTKTISSILGFYPNGSLVKLSDGRLAFVHRQTHDPENPLVFVLTDPDRNRLDNPLKKDLSEEGLDVRLLLRT